jgi:phosphoribosyl 1,2-cyclic phosphodiesterase
MHHVTIDEHRYEFLPSCVLRRSLFIGFSRVIKDGMDMQLCVLGSSSDGNATVVWNENTGILIDAGFSAREVERRLGIIGLMPSKLDGIVLSHEHSDHTRGAGVLSRRFCLPVYANSTTFDLSRDLGSVWERRYFNSNKEFEIGDFRISPIVVPHDASEPNAFVIRNNGKKVTIATDMGIYTPLFIEQVYNSDVIVMESNYDKNMLVSGAYPPLLKSRIMSDYGHMSNNAAAETLKQIIGESTKHVLLAHLSKNNNEPDLAISVINEHLRGFKRVDVDLTFPNRCSKVIRL